MKILLPILVILLVSCGSSPEVIALETSTADTAIAISWTDTPTFTYTPSSTPTQTPTPTSPPTPTKTTLPSNTPLNTSTPTKTSSPSITPSNTSTPTATLLAPSSECVPTNTDVTTATVVGITDGDTITVQLEDGTTRDLRYIGIDAPDSGVAYSDQSTAKNSELVMGKVVTLVKDVSDTDQYDRLLRYVFVDNVFVNNELVRLGLATAGSWPPDTACDNKFKATEDLAKSQAIGIWVSLLPTAEPTTAAPSVALTGRVIITKIFYDGVVSDKEPDEYVEIRNDDSNHIDLRGWSLADEADHTFYFPEYVISPGETCRIYTNEVHPESCGFNYAFTSSAIWNNGGDCAYLKDSSSSIIDDYCY
jgi:micrococcal nuclease